jgi:hypothetical protein
MHELLCHLWHHGVVHCLLSASACAVLPVLLHAVLLQWRLLQLTPACGIGKQATQCFSRSTALWPAAVSSAIL